MANCYKTTAQIEAYSLNGKMTHAKWCEVASHLTACEVASEKPVKASKKSTTPNDHPGKGCKAAHPEQGHRAWKIAKSTAEKQSRAKKSKSRKTSTTRVKTSPPKSRLQRIVEDNIDGPAGVYPVDSPSRSLEKLLEQLLKVLVTSQALTSESLSQIANSQENLVSMLTARS